MEIFGDRRIPEFQVNRELPNPITVHVAESRWQTCDCRTCQEKRLLYDSLPGKKIDWERHRRTPVKDWHYGHIFYVDEH